MLAAPLRELNVQWRQQAARPKTACDNDEIGAEVAVARHKACRFAACNAHRFDRAVFVDRDAAPTGGTRISGGQVGGVATARSPVKPCADEDVRVDQGVERDGIARFDQARLNAGRRGLDVAVDQIVITQGSQQAIDLVARAVIDPGSNALLEEPGYAGFRWPLHAMGGNLIPVPVDEQGIRIEGVEGHEQVRLVCLTPTHHYPFGVALSRERRVRLLQLAEERGFWILEDDYGGEFHSGTSQAPPLAALDRSGRVFYVGTFSKTLASGLRLGFVVVPPESADDFARLRYSCGQHNPLLEQATLAEFLRSGDFARHVTRMRRLYARRAKALLSYLSAHLVPGCRLHPDPNDLHLLLTLPAHTDENELCRLAEQLGLGVRGLSGAYLDPSHAAPGLLLGFTAATEDELIRAAKQLVELMKRTLIPANEE